MADSTNPQDLTSKVNNLEKRLREITPLAGNSIIVENTGVGIRISTLSGGNGGAEYNGYFKITEYANEDDLLLLKVINGAYENTEEEFDHPAGVAVINDEMLSCAASHVEIDDTADGFKFFYAKFHYIGAKIEFDGFYLSEDFPAPEDKYLKTLLATIEIKDKAIYTIRQQHTGVIHNWIFIACDEQ